jgi:hypothetical protein
MKLIPVKVKNFMGRRHVRLQRHTPIGKKTKPATKDKQKAVPKTFPMSSCASDAEKYVVAFKIFQQK